jgi:predicted nicotinamide N-methyase
MWGSTDAHTLLSSSPDVVVLSDVVYDPEGYAPLVASLEALAKTPETVVLMAHRSRNPKEHQFFEMLDRSFSFSLVDWQQDLDTSEDAGSAESDAKAAVVDPALQDVKIFRISRRAE